MVAPIPVVIPSTVGKFLPNILSLPDENKFHTLLYIMLVVFTLGLLISGIVVNILK